MDIKNQIRQDYFNSILARDLFDIIVGEQIGSGSNREVFKYQLDKTKVIKFEMNAGSFDNVMEWKAWERIENGRSNSTHGKLKKWLAPCYYISSNGTILIQARTYPPSPNYKWPKKLPDFMTDLKKENFGLIGNRLVCHDYGLNLHIRTNINGAMRKARWWDLTGS